MLKKAFLFVLVTVALVSLLTACGSKSTTTIPATTAAVTQPATTAPVITTTPPATQTPKTTPTVDRVATDLKVATQMADLLYTIETVQNYYDDGLTAMATFKVSNTNSLASNLNQEKVIPVAFNIGQNSAEVGINVVTGAKKVPKEFLGKLPTSGSIPAPPGACPAAADPQVKFMTKGSDTKPSVPVTPDLIKEKDIKTIPSKLVTMAQNDPGSLYQIIENMVPANDQRLATAQGWDDLLWSKLKAMQQPAESLMDYQLWNASEDIMKQISDLYRQRLVETGVPQIVLDAYDASASGKWYSSSEPAPEDALA